MVCLDCMADASRRRRRRAGVPERYPPHYSAPTQYVPAPVKYPTLKEAVKRMNGKPYEAGDRCPHCGTKLLSSYDQDGDITCFSCGWVGTPTESVRTCAVCQLFVLTVLDEREQPVCEKCWTNRLSGTRYRPSGRD